MAGREIQTSKTTIYHGRRSSPNRHDCDESRDGSADSETRSSRSKTSSRRRSRPEDRQSPPSFSIDDGFVVAAASLAGGYLASKVFDAVTGAHKDRKIEGNSGSHRSKDKGRSACTREDRRMIPDVNRTVNSSRSGNGTNRGIDSKGTEKDRKVTRTVTEEIVCYRPSGQRASEFDTTATARAHRQNTLGDPRVSSSSSRGAHGRPLRQDRYNDSDRRGQGGSSHVERAVVKNREREKTGDMRSNDSIPVEIERTFRPRDKFDNAAESSSRRTERAPSDPRQNQSSVPSRTTGTGIHYETAPRQESDKATDQRAASSHYRYTSRDSNARDRIFDGRRHISPSAHGTRRREISRERLAAVRNQKGVAPPDTFIHGGSRHASTGSKRINTADTVFLDASRHTAAGTKRDGSSINGTRGSTSLLDHGLNPRDRMSVESTGNKRPGRTDVDPTERPKANTVRKLDRRPGGHSRSLELGTRASTSSCQALVDDDDDEDSETDRSTTNPATETMVARPKSILKGNKRGSGNVMTPEGSSGKAESVASVPASTVSVYSGTSGESPLSKLTIENTRRNSKIGTEFDKDKPGSGSDSNHDSRSDSESTHGARERKIRRDEKRSSRDLKSRRSSQRSDGDLKDSTAADTHFLDLRSEISTAHETKESTAWKRRAQRLDDLVYDDLEHRRRGRRSKETEAASEVTSQGYVFDSGRSRRRRTRRSVDPTYSDSDDVTDFDSRRDAYRRSGRTEGLKTTTGYAPSQPKFDGGRDGHEKSPTDRSRKSRRDRSSVGAVKGSSISALDTKIGDRWRRVPEPRAW